MRVCSKPSAIPDYARQQAREKTSTTIEMRKRARVTLPRDARSKRCAKRLSVFLRVRDKASEKQNGRRCVRVDEERNSAPRVRCKTEAFVLRRRSVIEQRAIKHA